MRWKRSKRRRRRRRQCDWHDRFQQKRSCSAQRRSAHAKGATSLSPHPTSTFCLLQAEVEAEVAAAAAALAAIDAVTRIREVNHVISLAFCVCVVLRVCSCAQISLCRLAEDGGAFDARSNAGAARRGRAAAHTSTGKERALVTVSQSMATKLGPQSSMFGVNVVMAGGSLPIYEKKIIFDSQI